MSLDPTGKGRQRWSNRWKAALNAFDMTFDGRLSSPARGTPRGRASRRCSHRGPVTVPPGRPAPRVRGTWRVRRRGHRPIPARRRPGLGRSTARAASPGPRASPPRTRTLPDLRQPRPSGIGQGGVSLLCIYARLLPARRQTPTMRADPLSAPITRPTATPVPRRGRT